MLLQIDQLLKHDNVVNTTLGLINSNNNILCTFSHIQFECMMHADSM